MPEFHGVNEAYVLELYELYRERPDAVDPQTRAFFATWSPQAVENGYHAIDQDVSMDDIESTMLQIQKAVGAVSFAQAIRQFGHLEAQIEHFFGCLFQRLLELIVAHLIEFDDISH